MKPFELALKYYGLREITGGLHNDMILDMFKYIGHGWVKNDETAWCAGFVNYCLKRCGYLHSGKLNARSLLDLPNAVAIPELGDVMIFWRIAEDSPYGHAGFFMNELNPEPDNYWILGGNQNNMVMIKEYPQYKLLGIRRPSLNK